MRAFRDVGSIFGGSPAPPPVPTVQDMTASDQAAREEASRKARAAAAARTGKQNTLLTGLGGDGTSSLDTTRRTLLGGTA
jgi:hypothetical protein